MGDTLTCPECGMDVDSVEDLESEHDIAEMEIEDDGSINLFGNRDLFLCKGCKAPLGFGK